MEIYIIAEIGINHNGDLDIAKRLIDIAVVAGVDSVKFQKRNPNVCIPDHQKSIIRDTPWGPMTYLNYKHRIEFNKNQYDEIDSYCRTRKISWSASPWDLDSVKFLKKYDIPYIKFPSPLLTDLELLRYCKTLNKKIILSTGMSTLDEIDDAVEVLRGSEFALLHCNSTYPAPINQLNLRVIQTLKNRYGCEVGYSGHEYGLVTTMASIYLGATIIERHITLDRTMWGTDQMCSVEPHGLIKLVRGIRELSLALGSDKVIVTDGEKEMRKKLRK